MPEEEEASGRGASNEEVSVGEQTLGNVFRHTAEDHFDWGSIKERIFGDFGKRPEQQPIRRLSFVPDPTSDEMVVPKYAIGHFPAESI